MTSEYRREADPILERIVTALDGPWSDPDLDGKQRRLKEQGVIWQTKDNGDRLRRIEQVLANGIRTKLSPTVTASIITAATFIVVALIPFVWASLTGEPIPLP